MHLNLLSVYTDLGPDAKLDCECLWSRTPSEIKIKWSFKQLVVFRLGAGGELQTYQIRTASAASSLPQTVVMASSMGLTPGKTDDPTMKREIRLAKNRWWSVSLVVWYITASKGIPVQRLVEHDCLMTWESLRLSIIITTSHQLE